VLTARTRIDVALPADVAVADLVPILLRMARSGTPDGGTRHGGWCLARVGQPSLDNTSTLTGNGVLDGELLQLRRRSESPPPALFDDVIDAVAASTPDSFRPWTQTTARAAGCGAGLAAIAAAASAVLLGAPGPAGAATAGAASLVALTVGTVLSRVYRDRSAGAVVGVGALPFGFVAGYSAVPGGLGRPNLLLAFVLVAVLAAVGVALLGAGVTAFTAAGSAAVIGSGASLVAVLVAHPAAGIGAGAAAVALLSLSAAPRLTIALARLPLPAVPTSLGEVAQDPAEPPDYRVIEARAELGHHYLTGLTVGFGAAAAAGALLAARQGTLGVLLAATVALVLMLRARTYANAIQAAALLGCGSATVAGLLIGWLAHADAATRTTWVFATAVLLAAASITVGVAVPPRRFSPPLRRGVELLEAVLIAAVLPLTLGVVQLYATMRGL